KGIFVHWWVTQKGKEKISKSKGGAEHITEAATLFGVDAMRLYYSHIGSPFVDIEWDTEIVNKYKNRIVNVWTLVNQLNKITNKTDENIDNWLKSIMNKSIKKILDAFEIYDLRTVTNEIFFEFIKHLQWYIKRGGSNEKLLKETLSNWIKLMSPITPHLAEELWSLNGEKNFVTLENYPDFNPKEIHEKEEVGEYLISKIIEDVNEIIKITKITPEKVYIYTSTKWKQKLVKKALELYKENKLDINNLMKTAISDPDLKKQIKDVSNFAGKLLGEIKKINEIDKQRYIIQLNEKQYIEKALDFLEKELSTKIDVYSADDKDIYDPNNKSKLAMPLRPAIYIEQK
ncbi:MAG: class I tRNA ligase family protein, partial [Thermoplasmatota archaeon]